MKIRKLKPEEKILVILRDELYGGSWDKMKTDLEARLKSRPYIFKIAVRIRDDLKRIKELRGYEKKNKVNLREITGEK